MLTTLTIDSRYDPAFIKSLTSMTAESTWGSGAGDQPGTQNIFFSSAHSEEIADAINGYDAAWLAARKAERIERVAAERKRAVIETFSFNGMPLKLDESTENALGKAYTSLSRQPEGTSIDWEVTRGQFMPFDLATVTAIADAAFAHVQACFSNAKRLTLLINAAEDLDALNAIELDGWPE